MFLIKKYTLIHRYINHWRFNYFLFKYFKWKEYAFSITPKGQKQNGRAHLLSNGGVKSGWQKLAFKKKFLRTQHPAGRKSLIKILFGPVGFCFNSNIMSFPNPFHVGRQNFLTVILCSNLPLHGFVSFLFLYFSPFHSSSSLCIECIHKYPCI